MDGTCNADCAKVCGTACLGRGANLSLPNFSCHCPILHLLLKVAVAWPHPVHLNEIPDLNRPPPDEAPMVAPFPSQPPAEPLRALHVQGITEKQQAEPHPSIAAHACSSSETHKRQRDDRELEARILRTQRKKAFPKHLELAPAKDLEIKSIENSYRNPSASHTTKRASREFLHIPFYAKHEKIPALAFREEKCKVSYVHNWKFLQNHPEEDNIQNDIAKAPDKTQTDKFFEFLYKVRYDRKLENKDKAISQRSFSIPKDNSYLYLRRFASYRDEFQFPKGPDSRKRYSLIFETILEISKGKIGLESSYEFLKEMGDSLATKFELARKSSVVGTNPSRIPTVIGCIDRLNRSVTVLIVLYLTLFEGHTEGRLNIELIESISHFLGNFWRKILVQQDENGPAVGEKEDNFRNLHELVSFKKGATTAHTSSYHLLPMTWSIVRFWEKSQEDLIFQINPFAKADHYATIAEIIYKIIFFSNYESIMTRIKRKLINPSMSKSQLNTGSNLS
ncbi:hypothetical protein MJO28_006484 [Puccinia striiformis f. sp. tritici]|uniref:Uncharacterized protein n=1 Tax=Puccinia striiformis f. sp. tritici TaxID=168172 RepID=A0ACC0EIU2_9BASI|nr:hypothetical protein MJO28_006484 [Puccinia striiformis f. sp. tritici]